MVRVVGRGTLLVGAEQDGVLVPLSEVAGIRSTTRDQTIHRKDLQPVVYVTADGLDLPSEFAPYGTLEINHVDLDHRAGTSRIPVTFPHILGREFAGEVASSAGNFKEGDRVWVTCRIPCRQCELCLAGRDNLCLKEGYFGLDIPGGYAEYVSVPITNLNALPSQVSFEDAAAAQIAFGTAWHVLVTRGFLQAGQTVLIQAAGSGIGSAAVQVAKLAGAGAIIATASSEKKLQQARSASSQPEAPALGRVVLAVAPWGEVFVDGRSRGVSPPVQAIELPAGAHTVEIRNGDFPAHVQRVVVRPGQPVRIRHRFK